MKVMWEFKEVKPKSDEIRTNKVNDAEFIGGTFICETCQTYVTYLKNNSLPSPLLKSRSVAFFMVISQYTA